VFLDKDRKMDNVQQHNNYKNRKVFPLVIIGEVYVISLVVYMHHEAYKHVLLIIMQGKQPGRHTEYRLKKLVIWNAHKKRSTPFPRN
jgi:hypothetical protein